MPREQRLDGLLGAPLRGAHERPLAGPPPRVSAILHPRPAMLEAPLPSPGSRAGRGRPAGRPRGRHYRRAGTATPPHRLIRATRPQRSRGRARSPVRVGARRRPRAPRRRRRATRERRRRAATAGRRRARGAARSDPPAPAPAPPAGAARGTSRGRPAPAARCREHGQRRGARASRAAGRRGPGDRQMPSQVDARRGPADRVERVDERMPPRAVVERVVPAPVRARGARDRQPAHALVRLPRVDDRLGQEPPPGTS